jgi:hypothetical protein
MTPPMVARLLEENVRFVAMIADSLLNFFYANRFAIKRLPITLQSPSFGIATVTLKGKTVSPVAQLFTAEAQRIGTRLTKMRKSEKQRYSSKLS